MAGRPAVVHWVLSKINPGLAMYDLFIGNKNYSSWSLRPWLLMTELGIPFAEHLKPLSEASSWAAFRAFSPTGKVPCLHAGEQVVWESLAIAEFLAERHPGVWPADASARAWARCAAAEMHAGFGTLRDVCSMSCGLRVALHEVPEALQADVDRIGELWGEGLRRFGGPFLAGNTFTAVDAFFAPVVFRIQTYGLTLPAAAQAYAERMLALPGMVKWYAQALREPLRCAKHDGWALQQGKLLADLRDPIS